MKAIFLICLSLIASGVESALPIPPTTTTTTTTTTATVAATSQKIVTAWVKTNGTGYGGYKNAVIQTKKSFE
jgi:hypothetical protein